MSAGTTLLVPAEGNEPPVDTVLREVTTAGLVHIWYRRDGHWTCTSTPRPLTWADVLAAAAAGSTFTVLYLPAGGAK